MSWPHLRRAQRWALEEAPAGVVLGLTAILGAVIALWVFGPRYIAGTSAFWSWPAGDAAMMLTGWQYFIRDSWHFPIAQTELRAPPTGVNILYLDALPLVAVLAKLLRPLLGITWHPYGVWHLAIYVLQGVLAALVARRLGLRSLLGGMAVAVLALSTATFLLRFYHEGLNAHFVLLWAFLSYLRTNEARARHLLAFEWTACIGTAVTLHPYLGAMVCAIAAAAFVRFLRRDPKRAGQVAIVVVALVTSVLIVFGYIPQPVPENTGQFGMASMNLLSTAVPFASTLAPRLPSPAIQEATGVQWDGANFLGVGVWSLVLVSLALGWKIVREAVSKHWALTCAVVALALYAPGNKWYCGRALLLSYEVPGTLQRFVDSFRATGRFFWPVTYAVLITAVVVVVRRLGRSGTLIVAIAAALQLVDATAYMRVARENVARPAKRELEWSEWASLLDGVTQVNTFPSNSCWFAQPEQPIAVEDRVFMEQREIEFMASARGIRTNGGRSARNITNCSDELEKRADALQGRLHPDELYVFMKPIFSSARLSSLPPHACREFLDAYACKQPR